MKNKNENKKDSSGKKEVKKLNVLKAFLRLLPSVFKGAPAGILLYFVLSTMHGVSFGLEALIQQRFFDSAASFALGKITPQSIIFSLCMLALVYIACQVLNGVANYLPTFLVNIITGTLSFNIHRKMSRLDPVIFEDTKKLDDINKAEEGKNNAVWFVFLWFTILTFYIPYFTFMSWFLFSLKPLLILSIVLVFIPTAITQIIRTKVFAKLEDKSAPVRREYDYYESCMVSREYFKETRLLGGFVFFRRLYLDTLQLLQKLRFKAHMRTNLFELGMKILTGAGYFGILYMIFDALMKQEITIGAFAAVFNALGMLYSIMDEVICWHIGNMAKNAGTIQNYLDFLDLPERTGSGEAIPENCDITLENVSFTYPGAEEAAVKNASFSVKNGETLAIVGENGSGKSTLIRLITGLYTPNIGRVLHGSVDTRDASMGALFRNVSGVFQKYQRYQMTLSENIGISDTKVYADNDTLDKCCTMAGLDSRDSSFTEGYDTMLSREFDGVDLSGGQWQRVALARGFFRNHSMIILDEPTAAIDPFEETRIYNRFAEISRNKTAIIVTHRLGSVKLADRIVVMKDGRVAEIGTHDELLNAGGEYARLYEAQEQWYREQDARQGTVLCPEACGGSV